MKTIIPEIHMNTRSEDETPQEDLLTTSGLTSALQIVNVTGLPKISPADTTDDPVSRIRREGRVA